MSQLRSDTIRLAQENPELRPVLLPLLAKSADEHEDEKESKFEEGEDVPLSELPEELQENVKDPPPSVKMLKKVLKKKGEVELFTRALKLAKKDAGARKKLMPLLKRHLVAASEIPTPPNPSNDRANEMGWDSGTIDTGAEGGDFPIFNPGIGKEGAALLRETMKLAAERPEYTDRLLPVIRQAMTLPLLDDELSSFRQAKQDPGGSKWKKLPKGWTDESRKKFWESLTSEAPKHKVTECMEKMKGKVSDTGAFCGALADRVLGKGWRSEAAKERKKKKAGDGWLTLDEVRKLCPPCADKMAAYNLTKVKESTIRLAIEKSAAQKS